MTRTTARTALGMMVVTALALILIHPRMWGAPGTPFRFTSIVQLEDGNCQMTYTGPAFASYRLWASTDINARPIQSTWTLLTNSTMPAAGAETFTDMQAANHPQRFFVITSP